MMILRFSPTSPFVRKVRIAAAVLGFSDRIEIAKADTIDPADSLRGQNPLGKVPALVLESGEVLFDSPVILEFLDALAGGGKIIPSSGPERFAALTRQALADGVMDAMILQVYEQRWRESERHSAKWLEHQSGKVARGLAVFERDPPPDGVNDVGAISLACALGFLDLRFAGEWRASHPKLVGWLDRFAAATPSFEATRFKG